MSRRVSSLASTSEAKVSFQGEEDVRPGTIVLSNPADAGLCRWSGERGTRRRVLPHRGVYQESGLLVTMLAMCGLCRPYRCVLAVSCFYFGICPRGRHGIVRGSSWRLDLVLGLTLRTEVRGPLRGFSEVCLVV